MVPFLPLLPFFWLLLEVAGFVIVGRAIGLLATLALVVLGAFVGSALLRLQGVLLLRRLQSSLAAGEPPAAGMVDAACLALAGVLLIIPGFAGDIVAFLLLLPPVRRILLRWIEFRMARDGSIVFGRGGGGGGRSSRTTIIDGEFTTLDDDPTAGKGRPDNHLPPS